MILFHSLPLWVSILRWITVLFILGEALVLLLGMAFFQKTPNPWFHDQNKLFLISDLIFGGLLFWAVVSQTQTILFPSVAWIGLLVTHAYRAVEPLFKIPYPFTAITGLVMMNFIKLSFLLLFVFSPG